MIPNIAYAIKTSNTYIIKQYSPVLEIVEEISRYLVILTMIINFPYVTFGYFFNKGELCYLILSFSLVVLYILGWIFLKKPKTRNLSLAIIPGVLFIESGILLLNLPLIIASITFLFFHLMITIKQTTKNEMIKLVSKAEIKEVMEIIDDAKALLKPISMQWQQGYPNEQTLLKDIENNHLFGLYQDNYLVGISAFLIGIDESYLEIYDGKWFYEPSELDLVIHRVAVRKSNYHQRIGYKLIKYGIVYAKKKHLQSIKIDTHLKNLPMQKIILNCGFTYQGIIYLNKDEEDNSRLAYEYDVKEKKNQ